MHEPNDAFLEFRRALKSVAGLTTTQQVQALKYTLLRALYRATDYRDRGEALQHELDRARAERIARAWEYDKHNTNLQRLVTERTGELAATRGEVASLEARCRALEELCRSLVRTIESATCEEEAPATLPSATKPMERAL